MTCHAGIIDLFVCLVFLVSIVCTAGDSPEGGTTFCCLTIVANNGAKHGAASCTNGCPTHDTV